MQDALAATVAAMAHYQATRPLGPGEAVQVAAAAEAVVGVVCPYAVACLARIFPGAGARVDLRAATALLAPEPVPETLGSGPSIGFRHSAGVGPGGPGAVLGEVQGPPDVPPAGEADGGGASGKPIGVAAVEAAALSSASQPEARPAGEAAGAGAGGVAGS